MARNLPLISLIQRVSEARVTVDGDTTGRIGRGILVFLAVQPGDTDATVARMAERVVTYRVFPDETGRMNRHAIDAMRYWAMMSLKTSRGKYDIR